MTENHLTLNLDKCKFMVCGTSQTLQNINADMVQVMVIETSIELVKEFKYLGVHLDPRLTFTKHIGHVTKKCTGRLRMLGKTGQYVSESISLQLYKSLIVPVIDYCDMIYDCLSATDSSKLQKVQNSALRIVLQCDRQSHVVDLHGNLNLTYLADRRHMHRLNHVHKCIHGLAPDAIKQQVSLVADHHAVHTRAATSCKLPVPNTRLETCRKVFWYRGPCLWNIVNDDITSKESLYSFKSALINSDMFTVM